MSTYFYLLILFFETCLWSCTSTRPSGPPDVCLINYTEFKTSASCRENIFNALRPIDTLEGLKRINDVCSGRWDGNVCTAGLNLDASITNSARGGLFDLRVPGNVSNGTFQAVFVSPPLGCTIRARVIKITKIEITLSPGLQVGVPTSQGTVKIFTSRFDEDNLVFEGGGTHVTPTQGRLQFVLQDVDASVSRARCRGVFKFMDPDGLYVEGSFNLRDFTFNSTFFP